MDGWNTIVSFWEGLFSGAMLGLGSVIGDEFPQGQSPQERILDHGSMESVSFPKTGDHCVEQMYMPTIE